MHQDEIENILKEFFVDFTATDEEMRVIRRDIDIFLGRKKFKNFSIRGPSLLAILTDEERTIFDKSKNVRARVQITCELTKVLLHKLTLVNDTVRLIMETIENLPGPVQDLEFYDKHENSLYTMRKVNVTAALTLSWQMGIINHTVGLAG